jgi:hypothetical protein
LNGFFRIPRSQRRNEAGEGEVRVVGRGEFLGMNQAEVRVVGRGEFLGMNQAEASRRIERLEEDLAKIEAEQKKIQELLMKLNEILGRHRKAIIELQDI